MANSHLYYDEVRLDVRDPHKLKVWVYIRCEIDCPHFVEGWYGTEFLTPYTTQQFFQDWSEGKVEPLDWKKSIPPDTRNPRGSQDGL